MSLFKEIILTWLFAIMLVILVNLIYFMFGGTLNGEYAFIPIGFGVIVGASVVIVTMDFLTGKNEM